MSIVRTAYAFSPTSISNCALWLDGADSSSFTLSGSAVTQWNDKSGNGGHATQSTSGNRPTFTGSGVIFNAASSQWLLLNTPFTSTHSIYIVATPTSASQVYLFGRNYTGGGGSSPSMIINYTGTSLEYYSGNDGTTRSTYASPTSTFIAGYVRTYGSSLLGRYNGSQIFSAGGPTSEPSSIAWGGLGQAGVNAGFYTGTIYEFMIFNTAALSTTQCQTIEGYLAQKWGLTASLPPGHPGLTSRIYRSDYLVPNKVKPVPYYTQFSPRQISGCSLWLDGTDPAGNGVVPSAGTLATWVDKSGSGNNATQSTGGNQPTYSNNGLVFSGSQWYQTSITSFPTAESIFIVFRTTTGIADIFAGTTGSSREVLLYTGNKIFLGSFGTDPSSFTPNAGIISLNTNILYSTQYTSSAITFNVNGSTTGSGSPPFTFSGTGTSWIGSSGYAPNNMNGTIYEFIYYNSSLSSTLRQQVESYLAQKWGLTASLPGDHLHLTQQAGAVTTVAKTKFKVTGLPRYVFASTGLAITHQDGRVWKVSSTAIGLNTGTAMSLTIYAGSDVFNSAGGRVALFDGGSSANAVRHSGYNMYANTFSANNYDFGWKFVSSGSGYLIYNDYPSYSSWQVSYDSGTDRVLIVPPGDGRYGLVWNVTPKVTLAYVYSSY